jgi:hypothetical protein
MEKTIEDYIELYKNNGYEDYAEMQRRRKR